MYTPAAIDRVFDALNTRRRSRLVLGRVSYREHGLIRFVFANGYEYEAKILERARPNRFALQYFEGVASFELKAPAQNSTDLLLVHSGVGTEQWSEIHAGWLNVLFPLKATLAFGVDLRNHDRGRSWEHGYADQ